MEASTNSKAAESSKAEYSKAKTRSDKSGSKSVSFRGYGWQESNHYSPSLLFQPKKTAALLCIPFPVKALLSFLYLSVVVFLLSLWLFTILLKLMACVEGKVVGDIYVVSTATKGYGVMTGFLGWE